MVAAPTNAEKTQILIYLFWAFVHSRSKDGCVSDITTRDVSNICFVFASVQNSGPNSVFVFKRIVSSEWIWIVNLYGVELETSTADFTQSVPAALAHTAWFWETNEGERVMARQHAELFVFSRIVLDHYSVHPNYDRKKWMATKTYGD